MIEKQKPDIKYEVSDNPWREYARILQSMCDVVMNLESKERESKMLDDIGEMKND